MRVPGILSEGDTGHACKAPPAIPRCRQARPMRSSARNQGGAIMERNDNFGGTSGMGENTGAGSGSFGSGGGLGNSGGMSGSAGYGSGSSAAGTPRTGYGDEGTTGGSFGAGGANYASTNTQGGFGTSEAGSETQGRAAAAGEK